MKLKEYCAERNITMASIARALKYSVPSFMNCVNGHAAFSYRRAKEISEYCNGEVSVDELIPYKPPVRCSKCHQIIRKGKGGS